MKRRTFIGAAATGLTIPTAFAQDASRYAGRSHDELVNLARRIERDIENNDRLTPIETANKHIDLAEVLIARHDALDREYSEYFPNFTTGPTTLAAMNLWLAASKIEVLCSLAPAPEGDVEMRRLRPILPQVRERARRCAHRYASSSNDPTYPEWLARVRAFTCIASVLAATYLGDREGIDEAVIELAQPRERTTGRQAAQALATAYGMVGDYARAHEMAVRTATSWRQNVERNADRRETTPIEHSDAMTTAAFASANAGTWREAWEYLLIARELRGDVRSLDSLEDAVWRQYDSVAAMVTDRNGSQLWLATRSGGWRQTRKFEITGNRRLLETRFAFQIPINANENERLGWSMLCLLAQSDVATERARFRPELDRRLADARNHTLPGFAAAFAQVVQAAREQGLRTLAWLPSPPLANYPVNALLVESAPAGSAIQITTLSSFSDVGTVAATRIESAAVLPISGGDEDIPLARVERAFVTALSPSDDSDGAWALHIASHAGVRDDRMQLRVGARTWITLDELRRRSNWRRPPRLVILSACSSFVDADRITSSAFGSRVQSPAREILALGVSGVIGTLWETTDVAALMFSTRLHLSLLQDGLEPRTAFQRTVEWLRVSSREELTAHVEALTEAGRIPANDAEAVLGRLIDMPDAVPFAAPYYWATWSYWGV